MIEVRTATLGDLPYVDKLQREFRHAVGFLSRVALEAYISRGQVAIGFLNSEPACYLLGVSGKVSSPGCAAIYQAAVQYDARHRLLGSALVDHFIEALPKTAVAIELWCAQDLEANFFWEFCGFTAQAFRAGSRKKNRVHLLWRRFLTPSGSKVLLPLPAHSTSGQTRKKEIVVPLPKGADWRNVHPSDLPSDIVTASVKPMSMSITPPAPLGPILVPPPVVCPILATGEECVSVIVSGRVRQRKQPICHA